MLVCFFFFLVEKGSEIDERKENANRRREQPKVNVIMAERQKPQVVSNIPILSCYCYFVFFVLLTQQITMFSSFLLSLLCEHCRGDYGQWHEYLTLR